MDQKGCKDEAIHSEEVSEVCTVPGQWMGQKGVVQKGKYHGESREVLRKNKWRENT